MMLNSVRSSSISTDVPKNRKMISEAYSTSTALNISDTRHYNSHRRMKRARRYYKHSHHCSPAPSAHKQEHFVSNRTVLVQVIERYQKANDYCSYRLIQKYQRCDDEVASELQKMRKKLAVQIKDQTFNRKDLISVINLLTEFKQGEISHESTKVPLLGSSINLWTVPPLQLWRRGRPCRQSHGNRLGGTVMSHAGVVNRLLSRYATSAVSPKGDEEICKVKQGQLTPLYFSKRL